MSCNSRIFRLPDFQGNLSLKRADTEKGHGRRLWGAGCAFSKLEPLKTRRLMKENWLKIFLKGLCVGARALSGVSGGSMAMILGIYDKLITSVSSFFACKKRNALFLLLFALEAVPGCCCSPTPLFAASVILSCSAGLSSARWREARR